MSMMRMRSFNRKAGSERMQTNGWRAICARKEAALSEHGALCHLPLVMLQLEVCAACANVPASLCCCAKRKKFFLTAKSQARRWPAPRETLNAQKTFAHVKKQFPNATRRALGLKGKSAPVIAGEIGRE